MHEYNGTLCKIINSLKQEPEHKKITLFSTDIIWLVRLPRRVERKWNENL